MDTFEIRITNFNLTYGLTEKPMLEHFVDFIYPAFRSGIVRVEKNSNYIFANVELIMTNNGYALAGALVKDNEGYITSKYEGKERAFISRDESLLKLPYSLFCLFLRNHRMIFIRNLEKRSPTLQTFQATTKIILKKYKRQINSKSKENKLPNFELHLTSIPSFEVTKWKFNEIKKITNLSFNFFPLNGEDNQLPGKIIREYLKNNISALNYLGSSSSSAHFRSPKNKDKVEELILSLNGSAITTIDAKTKRGKNKKFRNNDLASKFNFKIYNWKPYQISKVRERVLFIIGHSREFLKSIMHSSYTNDEIYRRNKNSIERLAKK